MIGHHMTNMGVAVPTFNAISIFNSELNVRVYRRFPPKLKGVNF